MGAQNNSLSVITVVLIVAFIVASGNNLTAKTIDDSTKTKKVEMMDKMHHNMDMKMDKKTNESTEMKEVQNKDKAGIVREGTIDLKKIDVNKDKKVFQDQMHWNVISDKKEKCPLCGMTLQEVSSGQAKENLLKNGFKVKVD